jgi:hypothetical protein
MCLRVTSAVPGLIISGARWDVEYTGHLKGEGLVQSSADRRVFIMPRDAADVDGDTSVGEHNTVAQLTVFPNPTTETIQWNANGITLNGWVNITDMAGRTVLQSQVGAINPVLYVGGLTAGWYNLVLTTNNGTVQQARFLRQ